MPLYPYLNFGGDCLQAFELYHHILGGELDVTMMSDIPAEENVPAEHAGSVANAVLRLDDTMLMGSDDPTGGFSGFAGAFVNYTLGDADEARRVFDALAEGGSVDMALDETFWSPAFGICVDRFGASWMVNVESAPGPS